MSAAISHVQLELAREPGHPQGDPAHAYHLYLPLTDEGRIDAQAWRDNQALCHVRRLRPNEEESRGRIVHGPGGRWIFDYDDDSARDDEVGFRLNTERLVPGEYISIREDDGKTHVFRVVSVRPS
jgi:hypothetical protein